MESSIWYKRANRVWKLSAQEFNKLVKESENVHDIVEKLGYKNYSPDAVFHINKRIEIERVDTSHFVERRKRKKKINREDIINGTHGYIGNNALKRRIIEEGLLEYKCEICGNRGVWNGMPISLQLDHKDGRHSNGKLENLRFLCPNCHSQTANYGSKNTRRDEVELYNKQKQKRANEEIQRKNRIERRKKTEDKNKRRIEIVKTCGIDFTKFGWVSALASIEEFGMKRTHIVKWMQEHMPEFYEECYIHVRDRSGKYMKKE